MFRPLSANVVMRKERRFFPYPSSGLDFGGSIWEKGQKARTVPAMRTS